MNENDIKAFIVGCLTGYLETKDDKAQAIEEIVVEVSSYYPEDFNYIEIY